MSGHSTTHYILGLTASWSFSNPNEIKCFSCNALPRLPEDGQTIKGLNKRHNKQILSEVNNVILIIRIMSEMIIIVICVYSVLLNLCFGRIFRIKWLHEAGNER